MIRNPLNPVRKWYMNSLLKNWPITAQREFPVINRQVTGEMWPELVFFSTELVSRKQQSVPWHFVYKFSNIPTKRGSPQEGRPYIRKHVQKVWFWMPIDLNLFTQCNSINFVSLALWYRPFSLLPLAFLFCATYSKSANRRAAESVREISDDLIIEDDAEIGKYAVLPQ